MRASVIAMQFQQLEAAVSEVCACLHVFGSELWHTMPIRMQLVDKDSSCKVTVTYVKYNLDRCPNN